MVCVGPPQVAVLMPPQFELPMQGRTMYSALGHEQMEPAALSSQEPVPQIPTRHDLPSQLQLPATPVRSAVAMASTTTGSLQEIPVVLYVPLRITSEHPMPSRVALHVFQLVHCVVAVTPEVKTSE